MITEQQAQNCMAYLELARTAIDNAELRIAGAWDSDRAALALCRAVAEMSAAVRNLRLCVETIEEIAREAMEKEKSAAASVRADA